MSVAQPSAQTQRSNGKLRRYIRRFALVLLLLLVAANLVAIRHAWVMTHFVPSGTQTRKPEHLTFVQKLKVLAIGVTIPKPPSDTTPESIGAEFMAHSVETADDATLELWLVEHENPRAFVVVFHGFAGSKSRMLEEADLLYQLGCRVLLVDFRGSGGSSESVTTVGMIEAIDVEAAVRFARNNSDGLSIIAYGQSMGAAAVMRALAFRNVAVDAVILESPFDRLISTVGARFDAMNVPRFPFAQMLVFWGGAIHGYNGFSHNPVEFARHIDDPALLLHGRDDKRITVSQAKSIHDNLAGPKSMVIIDGVAHEPICEVAPHKWKHAVSELIETTMFTKNTKSHENWPSLRFKLPSE